MPARTTPVEALLTPDEIAAARRWLESPHLLGLIEALPAGLGSTAEAAEALGIDAVALSGMLRAIRRSTAQLARRQACYGCGNVNCQGCPWRVWARSDGHCYICGWPVDPTIPYPHPLSATLDHMIPSARGGSNHYDNLALAHYECNMARADRLEYTFRGALVPPDPTGYHLAAGRHKAIVWRVAEYEHAVRSRWPRPAMTPELLALVAPELR